VIAKAAARRALPEGFVQIGKDKVKICSPQSYIESPVQSECTQRIFYVSGDHVYIKNITVEGEAEEFVEASLALKRPFKLYHYLYDRLGIIVMHYDGIVDAMVANGKLITTEVSNDMV
jgi:hypothetical protein